MPEQTVEISEDLEFLENFNLEEPTPIEVSNKYFKKLESLCERYQSTGETHLLNPGYIKIKALLFKCLEIHIKRDPTNVIEHHQEKRVWTIIHKEIELVKKSSTNSELPDFTNLCNEAIMGFSQCFTKLQEIHNPVSQSLIYTNNIRKLAGNLLLYIGDLTRYQLKASKKISEASETKIKTDVLGCYLRAKTIFPFEGRIYNQIALTLASNSDVFGSIYYFIRSVFCKIPFEPAMESLVKHFEKVRIKYTEISRTWTHSTVSKTAAKFVSLGKISSEFSIAFLRLIGIIFTKIGREDCKEVMQNLLNKLKIYLTEMHNLKDNKEYEQNIELLINTVVLLIFAVHYSVLGPIQKQSKKADIEEEKKVSNFSQYNNKQALETDTGLISIQAFCSIASMIINLVVDIEKNASLGIVLPICYWLNANKDLRSHIWEKYAKTLRVALFLILKKLKLNVKAEEITQIEPYINTMISQDYQLVGFVPLDSKILKKSSKQLILPIELPESKILQGLILKMLSEMEFTGDEDTKNEEIKEILPSPLKVDFKGIDAITGDQTQKIKGMVTSQTSALKPSKPLIIIDIQNIAMRHGDGVFSTRGIQIVVDFWISKGYKVVGFIPDYLLNERQVAELSKMSKLNPASVKPSKIPDNVSLLQDLKSKGIIATTPSQDYDDTYCIEYAKKHSAYIVTNDKFRDHVEKITVPELRKKESHWIRQHRIGFAFKGDEFLPNPDSEFFRVYTNFDDK